jgi:hypothetical protein
MIDQVNKPEREEAVLDDVSVTLFEVVDYLHHLFARCTALHAIIQNPRAAPTHVLHSLMVNKQINKIHTHNIYLPNQSLTQSVYNTP